MLGWLADQTHHTSWRRFTGFGQRLYVANANRETAETTLGTDLIYYNVTRRSLLLIQYKRMNHDGLYRPDGDNNLPRQLQRMRAVDRYTARNADGNQDFRMISRPSWFKICQWQSYIPQTADMIPGMYFPREQFEQLRKDPQLKGPHGGVGFGFSNAPSYLDNTTFNRLVESGLIGTAGTPTQLLYQQIVRSFNGKKSLVIATLEGDNIPQSQRNTEKRKIQKQI
jgi:hypothetical protein